MLRRALFGSTIGMLIAGTAYAGPQYVDESKYALSGYDAVAYFELPQVPVGQHQHEAVPGKASITAEYNGATWVFASEEHRDMFLADPEKYAPQFDGHCAYGVAKGGKVPGNPNLWRIVDGKLYFNITPTVVGFWEADIPGFLSTAESNWGSLESKPASSKSWKAIKENDGTYSTSAPAGG
jgi:YHS domain-containing protein